jgi:hypothetical protein
MLESSGSDNHPRKAQLPTKTPETAEMVVGAQKASLHAPVQKHIVIPFSHKIRNCA